MVCVCVCVCDALRLTLHDAELAPTSRAACFAAHEQVRLGSPRWQVFIGNFNALLTEAIDKRGLEDRASLDATEVLRGLNENRGGSEGEHGVGG